MSIKINCKNQKYDLNFRGLTKTSSFCSILKLCLGIKAISPCQEKIHFPSVIFFPKNTVNSSSKVESEKNV